MFGKWVERRRIRKQLEGCNYTMVKAVLIKQFAGGVIPKDLGGLLDKFISNPCIDTAIELILYDSKFMAFFQLSKQGGFTERLFDRGDLK